MNPPERLLKFDSHSAIQDAKLYPRWEQRECMENVAVVMHELFPDLFEFPVNVCWRPVGSPYVNWESWESDRYICLTSDPNQLFYAQIAYQLFHELGHLAIGYDPNVHHDRYGNRRNITAWFVETICMAISYVGMSRLTDQWKSSDAFWKRSFSYSFADNRYENINNQIRKLGSHPVDLSAYLRQNAVERLQVNNNDKTAHGVLAIKIAEVIEEFLCKDLHSIQSLSTVEAHTINSRSGSFQFMDFSSWIQSLSGEHLRKELAVEIHEYLKSIDPRLTDFPPQTYDNTFGLKTTSIAVP